MTYQGVLTTCLVAGALIDVSRVRESFVLLKPCMGKLMMKTTGREPYVAVITEGVLQWDCQYSSKG